MNQSFPVSLVWATALVACTLIICLTVLAYQRMIR